jgi:hypothetical protein
MDLLHRIRHVVGQDAARRNAAKAAHRLMCRRLERADADAFVSDHAQAPPPGSAAPTKAARASGEPL